jgi:hypothetical protein
VTRLTLALLLVVSTSFSLAGETGSEKRTGWIACNACSAGRVEHGESNAPNRECAQKCIREGSPVVFYNEATKSLLRVDNPEATKDQESHRIELVGVINAANKTIHVESVKVLEKYVAKCSVPPPSKP